MKAIWLSALFCLLSLSTIAQTTSIQGVLRDPNGKAVEEGVYAVTFNIYDVPIGGTAVWTEPHPSFSVKHGVFNAPFGSIQAFNEVADDSTYISVTIAAFAEMGPRIQLSTFPSAMSVNGTQNISPSSLVSAYSLYLDHHNDLIRNPNTTLYPTAYIEGSLITKGYIASIQNSTFSDIRMKEGLSLSDGTEDLQKLKQIEITNYQLIDKSMAGDQAFKKVIAQQIKEVYPQAIDYIAKALPNVYERTTDLSFRDGELTLRTNKVHTFVEGDKIDLYTATEAFNQLVVLATPDPNTFVVKMKAKPEAVFVYGKWVNDFHTVDYDALSMLNISATQVLSEQVATLQAENAALKVRLERLETLQSKVDQLLNNTTRASLNR